MVAFLGDLFAVGKQTSTLFIIGSNDLMQTTVNTNNMFNVLIIKFINFFGTADVQIPLALAFKQLTNAQLPSTVKILIKTMTIKIYFDTFIKRVNGQLTTF